MSVPPAIKFAPRKQADFYATLTARVNDYFKQSKKEKTGDIRLYIKSAVLLTSYILPFVLLLSLDFSVTWTLISYVIMGFGMAGIGFSIMHDANHGAYSKSPLVNKIMGYTMHFVGGSAALWRIQHNVLHHTYTNIHGHDEDIADKPILRLSPEGKWYPIHRLQQYYAILLYGLSTISWVTTKDFRQLRQYIKEGMLEKIGGNATQIYLELIVSKLLYFVVFFGLPLWLGNLSYGWYLLGFLFMHLIAGVVTTVVFQLAHVVDHTDFFQPNEANQLPNAWAEHQMRTTSNFARKNKLLSWYVGGLNFQIEHHLFTHISHVHYKDIAPIVKKTAEEFQIPYYEHKTLGQAIYSHWEMLGKLGRKEVVSLT